MPAPLLTLTDIALTFGGHALLEDASIQVHAGDRSCVVGRNGSGKSTLLKIAAGLVEPDGGTRFLQPGIHVAYLPQEPDLSTYDTVFDYVADAFNEGEDPYRGRVLLEELHLSPDAPTTNLSGGEARRAALARTLAPEPDILLLDEPTNHLDLPAIAWLERTLGAIRSALVLISHDRRFLETLTRQTVWIDRGRARHLNKGFEAFETWRDTELEAEALEAHKRDRKIAREENWMQGGVSGRRKRNMRRVAELQALRAERREARQVTGNVQFETSEAQASGKLVIEAQDLNYRYGDGEAIVSDLSLRLMRGDRLGLIGPNGIGKTTLLKILIGQMQPQTGQIRHGANLETAWIDQKRDALSETATLTDVLTGGRGDTVFVNGRAKHVSTYLREFLFQPEQARSSVRVLSGGERARLILARALAQPSNLMVLDEPTNDLDLETLDLLQELLGDYAGTLLVVSHDRDFLDRVCTSVLVAEGDGQWVEYAGGFSDMLAQVGPRGLATLGLKAASITAGEQPKKRPAGSAAPKSATSGSCSDSPAAATQTKRQKKLSYKEKYALETLPTRISELEAKIATIQADLSDPNLYAKDAARFQKLTGDLAKAQEELANNEERWLELEMLREEIEG